MNLTAFVSYRWLRRLAWSLGALFALGALAWVVLPPLAKTQAQIRLSELLGRQVTIGSLALSPWSLQLTVHDFAVATADGKGVQFSVDRLYVDAQAQSLLQGVPVIETLTVDAPQLQLTRLGEGHYDIDDIVRRLNQADDALSAPTPKFALYNLTVNHGSLDFADRADGAPRLHTLRDLALSLGFLSNLDSKRDAMVSPRLSFVLNGSRFESQASVNPFGQSPKAQAHIKISQLDIAPYLAYLPPDLPVQARSAIMDADLSVDFLYKPQTALTLSGSLMVSQLALQDLQGKPLFSADQLQIGLLELRPLERSARLSTMDVNAPMLHLARSAAGQLNFLPLEPAKHNATKKASAEAASAQAGAGVNSQTPAKPAWVLQLDTLTLKDAAVDWTDLATAPATRLGLRDLQVTVAKLQWPMQSAATLDLKTRLQSLPALSAAPTAQLSLQAGGTWDAGKAQAELADFDLGLVSGYISTYLEPSLSGQASTRFNLAWDGERQSALVQTLALRNVALVDGKAATLPKANAAVKNKGPSSADMPQWELLELSDLRIENQARTAYLGKVTLQKPSAGVRRDAAGHWMFEDWLKVAKPGAEALATQAAGNEQARTQLDAPKAPVPWKLHVGQFNLEDGSLVFLDRVPARPVRLEISGLHVQAKNMQPQGNTPMPLQLAAKVKSGQAEAGKVRYTGILMWDPLVVQGAMDMSDFPAHALATYALGGMNFVLLRADTSFKGQVYYAERAQGPELSLKGDAALEDFKANTAGKGAASLDEELLSWKALNVPGIDLRMAPGLATQVQVGGAALSDFYARLILSPQGRLNLQELGQSTPALAQAPLPKSNADASPVPSATSGITSNATQGPAAHIQMGPITMVNGRVLFSDRFIHPNYTADLTDLAGRLSGISNQLKGGVVQMADLELRGRAEGTAALEIRGKLNPLAQPLALDILGFARDLELPPLSPYAAKYAGYGIERGKLSVDLHYTVQPDGELTATNKLVLNQLTFGDKAEGTSASLPVKLAVALLADRNGVIELDLPISGSLKDPQFDVGTVIWKAVSNLVGKAITAPFSLLARALRGGGGTELSSVPFAPGSAGLSDAARADLDKLAQALQDRPTLTLTVVGFAHLQTEGEATKREKLKALLLAEKRRYTSAQGQDATQVISYSAEEMPSLLRSVYRRADITKPRTAAGQTQDIAVQDMEALLLANLSADEDDIRNLALQRAVVVKEYLADKQLPVERIFIGTVKTGAAAADAKPQVELAVSGG